jgi:hypothetical protein
LIARNSAYCCLSARRRQCNLEDLLLLALILPVD